MSKNKKYDFIIIGGGAAGCVLARRLADLNNFSVLLIEAGPKDKHLYLHLPAGYALLKPQDFNWCYETIPQKNFNKRKIWYPQGCVVGGSSSINGQVFTRGNKGDYDSWSNNGCEGWSFNEILKYFRKSEDNNRIKDEYHGQNGPLKVSDNTPHKLTKAFVESSQQMGLKFNSDFNGLDQEGCGYHQVTNRDGRRSSAASSYLKNITKNKNFSLITNALVTKINVKNGKVISIIYKQNNKKYEVEVGKELLLTAGAIGSPKLLLLSGIGPPKDLEWLGIDRIVDSPFVGKNLHDHTDVFCISECSGNYSFDKYKSWYMKALAGIEYFFYKTGIISSNICEGGAFLKINKNETYPDVQFNFLPGTASEFGLNMKKITNGVALNTIVTRPRSRGEVKLNSSDPSKKPLIDPNYWSDEYDVNTSVKAIKFARNLLKQNAFKPYIKEEIMPGKEYSTDKEIKDYARKYAKQGYHPVGTCKMGSKDDPTAVVTSNLRLKNLENLRVCDSSIMPSIISSNTYAATLMIAEKASDIIAKKYNK